MAQCPMCGMLVNPEAEVCRCGIQLNAKSDEQQELPPTYPVSRGRSKTRDAAPPGITFDAAQPTIEHLEAAAAPALARGEALEAVPEQLRCFSQEMEAWARANEGDARRDTWRYWGLKAPALLSTASSAFLVLSEHRYIAAILSSVATTCVIIDAVNPGGQLRNAHLRAVHDLRDLQHQIMNGWRIGVLKGKARNILAAEILSNAERNRDRIAKDLRAAETSFASVSKGRR